MLARYVLHTRGVSAVITFVGTSLMYVASARTRNPLLGPLRH
jgi:hypothetical protein